MSPSLIVWMKRSNSLCHSKESPFESGDDPMPHDVSLLTKDERRRGPPGPGRLRLSSANDDCVLVDEQGWFQHPFLANIAVERQDRTKQDQQTPTSSATYFPFLLVQYLGSVPYLSMEACLARFRC